MEKKHKTFFFSVKSQNIFSFPFYSAAGESDRKTERLERRIHKKHNTHAPNKERNPPKNGKIEKPKKPKRIIIALHVSQV